MVQIYPRFKFYFSSWGSKQWHSGESTCLPPMWPGFKSRRRRHMWVEFVVGSLPCLERSFSRYSGFPLSSKPTFPNSNLTRNQIDKEPLCGCATCKSLFIFICYSFYNHTLPYPKTNTTIYIYLIERIFCKGNLCKFC